MRKGKKIIEERMVEEINVKGTMKEGKRNELECILKMIFNE